MDLIFLARFIFQVILECVSGLVSLLSMPRCGDQSIKIISG